MLEVEQLEAIQRLATSMVLCSRNKLIEDIIVMLPEYWYQKGAQMMEENHTKDKKLWNEAMVKILK